MFLSLCFEYKTMFAFTLLLDYTFIENTEQIRDEKREKKA